MDPYDRSDLVVLALDLEDESDGDDVVPRERSVPGIGDALGVVTDSVADRVALLSTIEDLKQGGIVVERRRRVEGQMGTRNVYFLDEAGENRARELRARFEDETVRVREQDGTEREVRLGDVDEYFPEPALPRALARSTDDGILYASERTEGRFVNRASELETLSGALERAERGRSGAVLVGGEAGVGKTTLVTDELASMARERDVEVLVAQCQRDATEPYAPFKTVLEGLPAVDGASPFERDDVDPDDAAAYRARRTALYESVADSLERAAGDRPLLVVLDDLHLADEPTLSLAVHLATSLEGPVLLAATYRPGQATESGGLAELLATVDGAEAHSRLDLAPFGREHAREQVARILGRRDLPEGFVDLVYDRTGGNPLFVKESVARLVETGEVDPERGVFPADEAAISPPDRVESVVDRRLEELDEVGREVLAVGGLLGQVVPRDVLTAAVDVDADERRRRAALLVDSGIWERAGEDLRFVSGLVRETVVDRLPDERCRTLHARIATAIEAVRGDDPGHYATAATHRRRAGDDRQAFERYLQAADNAKAEYASRAAREYYRRALDLARGALGYDEDSDEVVDVLEALGEVHYLLGEYEEADKYYRFVQERIDDPERYREMAWQRAGMFDSRGQYERALSVAEDALDRHGVADTTATVRLFAARGNAHNKLENQDAARQQFRRARELAADVDDPTARAIAFQFTGGFDIHWGTVDAETVAVLGRAVDAAEESEDDRALANAVNDLAMALLRLDRLEEAEAVFQRCLDLHEAIGDPVALAKSHRNLARIYRRQGDLDRTRSTLEAGLETAENIRNTGLMAAIHEDLGSVDLALGDTDAALQHRRRTLELCEQLGRDLVIPSRTAAVADLVLLRGDPEEARNLVREAYERGTELEDPISIANATASLGDVARATGDCERAAALYEEGIDLAVDEDHPATAGPEFENRCGLAACRLAMGDIESGREQIERAATIDRHLDVPDAVGAGSTLAIYRARYHRLAGEHDEAERAVREGLERARESATRSVVEECRALLERARLERDRGARSAARDDAGRALDLAERTGCGRYERACRDLLADLP